MQHYQLFIGGEWVGAASGDTFRTANPADARETVAEYANAGAAETRQAFDAAASAFPAWSSQTPVARGRILSAASQILAGRKTALQELLTREEGKTLAEASGEVQRAIDIFRFYGGLSYTLGGQTLPHDLPGNFLYTRRDPLGVVGLITPWNFPVAIPAWKTVPALLCGNTVVLKPASATPALALEIAKALSEAGLPKGALNVITGPGQVFGDALTSHPAVQAVSFTGSQKVGSSLYTRLAPRMVRAQMEMGGKNPTLVLADADLDLAARLVATAGFGLTGQACTATSRVIVERPVLAAFTERLVATARALKVGPGLAAGVQMGPAVSKSQRQTDLDYIEIARGEGAEVLAGGGAPEAGDLARGYFVQPTVLANVRPDMRIAQEEVFGPVVGLIPADGLDEAFAIANNSSYGLSAGIVTTDLRRAIRFAERAEAGMVKVNQTTVGASIQAPFGGFKQSGSGMFREMGNGAIEFFTKIKTVYIDGQ